MFKKWLSNRGNHHTVVQVLGKVVVCVAGLPLSCGALRRGSCTGPGSGRITWWPGSSRRCTSSRIQSVPKKKIRLLSAFLKTASIHPFPKYLQVLKCTLIITATMCTVTYRETHNTYNHFVTYIVFVWSQLDGGEVKQRTMK